MTAPAAAPASAPIAPPPPRAPAQPPTDAHGFAAMLDSLPGGAAKAGASTAEGEPRPSSEKPPDHPPGEKPGHSLLGDGLLLASLPFAAQAASTVGEGAHEADPAPSLGPPATKGSEPAGHGASLPASAKAPEVGRLIGERAFHFGASVSVSGLTGRTRASDPPFAPDAASAPPANPAPATNPGGVRAFAAGFAAADAAPTAPRAAKAGANRAGSVRPANEAARSEPKPEAAPAPPAVRAPNPARTSAPAGSGGERNGADGRPPDPAASAAQPAGQAGPFGATLAAPFAAAGLFALDSSSAGVADIAPRGSAPGSSPASTAPPVREIDVDLSPDGLGDVSMTMRLAGDRLSLVVRAASSHTLRSIEGARDAIADRLAAIGQPLDSLIIKQAGVKADGTNGNPASADDGSAGDAWRSAQGAGDERDANGAASRRGAHRDRGF